MEGVAGVAEVGRGPMVAIGQETGLYHLDLGQPRIEQLGSAATEHDRGDVHGDDPSEVAGHGERELAWAGAEVDAVESGVRPNW